MGDCCSSTCRCTPRDVSISKGRQCAYVVLSLCIQGCFMGGFEITKCSAKMQRRVTVAASCCVFMLVLVVVNSFLYRVERNLSLWSWTARQLTLKRRSTSAPLATASDVKDKSTENEVKVDGMFGTDASHEFSGFGAQLSGDRAQAEAIPLEGTVRVWSLQGTAPWRA